MDLFPLEVACPRCGSRNVTYTCEPKCCFNHLCGDCYGTFELRTSLQGGAPPAFEPPRLEPDSLAPTAACARCGSVAVYLLQGEEPLRDRAVCTQCRTRLSLVLELT